MGERLPRLLIVEDDPNTSEMLAAYFSVQGYEVLKADTGEKAVGLCQERLPDLVLLDIRLPDIDGYKVAGRLKADARTQKVPVIFLTERRERIDRLSGLELGVVDYVTKPFDMQELRLRVRNLLRRVERRPVPKHPLTGLPDGEPVDGRLEGLLKEKSAWALLALKLSGLEAYRKRYGVVAADDALRGLGLALSTALAGQSAGGQADFAGHLGPEAFVVVTNQARVEPLKKRLLDDAFAAIPHFYPARDRSANSEARRAGLELTARALRAGDGPFESVEALRQAALKAKGKA